MIRYGHGLDHNGYPADGAGRQRVRGSAQPGCRRIFRAAPGLADQLPGSGQVRASRRMIGLGAARSGGISPISHRPQNQGPSAAPLSATTTPDPVLVTTPTTIALAGTPLVLGR